jgi:hypothetical protein
VPVIVTHGFSLRVGGDAGPFHRVMCV